MAHIDTFRRAVDRHNRAAKITDRVQAALDEFRKWPGLKIRDVGASATYVAIQFLLPVDNREGFEEAVQICFDRHGLVCNRIGIHKYWTYMRFDYNQNGF